jgi:hypothetical protein
LTLPRYTVEVSWSGRVDRPPTDWLKQHVGNNIFTEGQEQGPAVSPAMMGDAMSESQMVNFSR